MVLQRSTEVKADIVTGLMAKGGELKSFAIAVSAKNFVWAKAVIVDDKVFVWDQKVHNPVAVRYVLADNPDGANLNNMEALPAAPFRIDY